ncbi:DUF6624 domain-containing protein [Undibacterium sp.]|uniref:DUF6624 domain-containing protein n=1 Tax=Undibacterium sp. TaxID=1914977 RepID=UPI00374D9903
MKLRLIVGGWLLMQAALPALALEDCEAVPGTLQKMVDVDQDVRMRIGRLPFSDASLNAEAMRIDTANTVRLKQIIKDCGWPDSRKYGPYIPAYAWLIAQHADLDPEFQSEVLELIRPLAMQGYVRKKDFAYLTDRVMYKKTGKQLYGSQLVETEEGAVLKMEEIDSIEEVNKRRAEVGLPTMEEYLRTANQGLKENRAGK